MQQNELIKPIDQLDMRIAGGLSINYSIGSYSEVVTGSRPIEVVNKIKIINKRLGKYKSDQLIIDYVLSTYQARDPEGFDKYLKVPVGVNTQMQKKIVASHPDLQRNPMHVDTMGPIIWKWLNLFGVSFDKNTWLHTISMITDLLDPGSKADSAGCSKCFMHWRKMLQEDSPDRVTNCYEAAKWVNRTHNKVNLLANKPEFSYDNMVRYFGAPIPTKDK